MRKRTNTPLLERWGVGDYRARDDGTRPMSISLMHGVHTEETDAPGPKRWDTMEAVSICHSTKAAQSTDRGDIPYVTQLGGVVMLK